MEIAADKVIFPPTDIVTLPVASLVLISVLIIETGFAALVTVKTCGALALQVPFEVALVLIVNVCAEVKKTAIKKKDRRKNNSFVLVPKVHKKVFMIKSVRRDEKYWLFSRMNDETQIQSVSTIAGLEEIR